MRMSCSSFAALVVGALFALSNGCSDDTAAVVDGSKTQTDATSANDVVAVPKDGEVATDSGTQKKDSAPAADAPSAAKQLIADHVAVANFGSIPASLFNTIRTKFDKIYYGHTSHGSQLVTGMEMLQAQDGTKYKMPTLIEPDDDLGHTGSTTWVNTTKNALAQANHGIKMVIWSWCGGASDNTPAGINIYLTEMDKLEKAYPNIVFVYMTGHLDGTGPTGTLYVNNNLIRDYCKKNNKILFDFADIESYDPSGKYYPNEDDSCGWCSSWCNSNTCPTSACSSCAHSHCFNCYLKGKGMWWLLARAAGWNG